VILETEGTHVARALITAPVVGHEIESIGPSRESGEGAAAVQPAVDADDRGFGTFDATLGDREASYRRRGDEVQTVWSGWGTHLRNLTSFDVGEPLEYRPSTPRLEG